MSLWTLWTVHALHQNQLTYWNWPKEINLMFGRGGGWVGGINRSRKSKKSMEGRGGRGGETVIFLPRLSTWTLACASSKSSHLSAHPDERAGWRVMNVRCGMILTAGQGQRSPHWLADNIHRPYQQWVKPSVSLRVQIATRGFCVRSGMTFGKCSLKREIW